MEQNINLIIKNILQNEVVERHSYFQLKHFLIGKEPTIQSKLWRCIREIKIRQDSVDAINLEIEDVKDDIKLIEIDLKRHESDPEEEQVIRSRKNKRKKQSFEKRLYDLNQKLKNIIEECDFLANSFSELEEIEKLKSFDDTEEQSKYWEAKLTEELNAKLISGTPPDAELIKTIFALDSNSKIRNNLISNINKQTERKSAHKLGTRNDI